MDNFFEFFKDKKIIITGHTGFKGTWLMKMLDVFGPKIYGISIDKYNNIYQYVNVKNLVKEYFVDIRDIQKLSQIFQDIKPDIVFHLAAQPLVIDSYIDPYYNFTTNVIGTINVLNCINQMNNKISFINITTDKVYKNLGGNIKYTEEMEIFGYDPYSNSKSCADMISQCYHNTIFNENISMSILRSGNVIGGGDNSKNRIIVDILKSIENKNVLHIRNLHSIRPYQHVLDVNFVYILLSKLQWENKKYCDIYNICPDSKLIINNLKLINEFKKYFPQLKYELIDSHFIEADILLLSNKKLKKKIKWSNKIDFEKMIKLTWDWFISVDKNFETEKQIKDFYKIWGINFD